MSGSVLGILALEDSLSIVKGGGVVRVGSIEFVVLLLVAMDLGDGLVDSLLRTLLEFVDDTVLLISGGSDEDNVSSSLLGEIIDLGALKRISSSEIENSIGALLESERLDVSLKVHEEWHRWDREGEVSTLGAGGRTQVNVTISNITVLCKSTTNDDWHVVGDWGNDLIVGSVTVEEEVLKVRHS